jgi:hypothetical protein
MVHSCSYSRETGCIGPIRAGFLAFNVGLTWDDEEFRIQNADKHPNLPASSLLPHFCFIRLFDHVPRLKLTVVL